MWITLLIQAIGFAVTHLPEIVAALRAIFAFFRAHRSNPAMSGWVKDFSTAMEQARQAKDPRPLIDFLERIKKDVTK